MQWVGLLVVAPFVTGLAAGFSWRASTVLQALGCGLAVALAATLITAPFLPIEGWGFVGVIALVLTPALSAPAAVAGAVAGMTLRASGNRPSS
jgi:hypothetical protein